jgi:hypothetical protein
VCWNLGCELGTSLKVGAPVMGSVNWQSRHLQLCDNYSSLVMVMRSVPNMQGPHAWLGFTIQFNCNFLADSEGTSLLGTTKQLDARLRADYVHMSTTQQHRRCKKLQQSSPQSSTATKYLLCAIHLIPL